MRIAYEASTVVPNRSGIGRVTEQLAHALDRHASSGDELWVMTNGEPLERLHSVPHYGPLRPTPLWMQVAVPRIARREKFDLYHFTNSTSPVGFRQPYVTTIHDLSLFRMPEMHPIRRRAYQRTLLRSSARGARRVITISESSARDVVRLLGVEPGRVVVTPLAIDERFHERASSETIRQARERYGLEAPYVLYVGNIEPRKNLVRLIDAFDRASTDGAILALAGGSSWLARDVTDRVVAGGASGRVRLVGHVADEDLPALFQGAIAAAYPSLLEGFGLPVLEAMASGTAALASDIPAIAELASGSALLVDPYSVEAIANGLTRLLGDTALRERLVASGLERSRAFSWRQTAELTWQAYRDALE